MREPFNQRQPKIPLSKGWVMGAIATPVLLGMVGWLWSLSNGGLQPESSSLSDNEPATLSHPHHETLTRSIWTVVTVAGGVFLLFKRPNAQNNAKTANFSGAALSGADFDGADLNGADFNRADLGDASLCGADLCGADLTGANLSGANLSGARLSGANLISASLCGADLSGADLRYADLSGTDLRYANLSRANLRYANLSGADLNCTLLTDANLSDANLSDALMFFINSREVLNLEPLQLEAKPSPFLCNVALPSYSKQPKLNPNRDCDRIPQLLSVRYNISLEEAQGIVNEARQHRWD